ncbi:monofunctional biosynthetic peptidoglycan transglycosylase [Bdellovibrio sp. NC01]|uniref:monofunctional biosynthetic peptidoglycan transglycosylase n=1 Tax=Bdellovibrio sp. NC01 TaxID=2220073 RepID=UPI00115ADEC7|nr:monofunctional biosynthetic peptidoglycan transglycosylase [Bdellovibrio sp. NC01]QDK36223.1 monofunctional biosynthetic peptidoglycan transglycosylase [Bdellovibrio sp. NC01]
MKWIGVFFFAIAAMMLAAALFLWNWLPTPSEIKGCMITSMYHVTLCPGSSEYVPLNKISPYLVKTVILTEDSNFYNHHGFEWDAIEKNFREGWEKGVYKRGGSTLTQQLAKNMFLNKDRTFLRKGLEAIITDRIEKTLTKKEILERYFNVVEFGKDIYGVKKAAAYYFKKSPAELDVVESAFLAMILPNPEKYSKSYFKKELTPFARKRLDRIVGDMYKYSRINEAEYEAAVLKIQNFLSPAPPPEEIESTDTMTLQDLEKAEQELQQDTEEEQ